MADETQSETTKERKMTKTSFAETVNSGKLMATGLQANAEAIAKRGIDAEFTATLNTTVGNVERINAEQEALKASLKTKTAELDAELATLNKMYSEAKKVVKLAIDKTRWLEFGISDKR
ncbi:MAG: hypothetical protein WC957_03235 [Candidatus Neomarinimicrobiota bacterium]|jgi:hypothetical protein|nr:hypothetical protein [Candidatus Neomarinimicrobiota bacterium]